MSSYKPVNVLLIPIPQAARPFERIALDIGGPFPRGNAGYQYVLMMEDYATRFPDTIPLKNITTPKIGEELIKWVARVGIAQNILTDQGRHLCREC